jgi:hypothetical protein
MFPLMMAMLAAGGIAAAFSSNNVLSVLLVQAAFLGAVALGVAFWRWTDHHDDKGFQPSFDDRE